MATYIAGFYIDASVREEHTLENEVTVHPVEDGADVTDHIRRKPSPLTIEGVVSDTPIGDVALLRSDTVLPSREALEHIERIFANREPITVATALKSYTDMVPVALSMPRDATTGDALGFTLRLMPLVFARIGRVTVQVADPRGKAKVNRGNKATTPTATPPAAEFTVMQKLIGVRRLRNFAEGD